MSKTIISRYNDTWDAIAKRELDNEYNQDVLLASQPVSSWASPVYEFEIEEKEIFIDDKVLIESDYYKAPWEE